MLSIAFAVTPISAAGPAAVNLPFSERKAIIFSTLCTLQNLHKSHLYVDVDCTITAEGAAGRVTAGNLIDRTLFFRSPALTSQCSGLTMILVTCLCRNALPSETLICKGTISAPLVFFVVLSSNLIVILLYFYFCKDMYFPKLGQHLDNIP